MGHDKFFAGPPEAIRDKLVRDKRASGAPASCPYLLGMDGKAPGHFVLYWLPGTATV